MANSRFTRWDAAHAVAAAGAAGVYIACLTTGTSKAADLVALAAPAGVAVAAVAILPGGRALFIAVVALGWCGATLYPPVMSSTAAIRLEHFPMFYPRFPHQILIVTTATHAGILLARAVTPAASRPDAKAPDTARSDSPR